MKEELATFIRILRRECPEFFEVLAPGIEPHLYPPSLRLPADLQEFYRWSAGVDVEKAMATASNPIVVDYSLLFMHYFADFKPLSWEEFPADFSQRRYMETGGSWASFPNHFDGVPYFHISLDECGNHFMVRADGQSDFVYFLKEGSETPIPAFTNMTAIISTLNHLFETRNLYYQLEERYPYESPGQRRVLEYTPEAYEIFDRLNRTPETLEYWSEGLEAQITSTF